MHAVTQQPEAGEVVEADVCIVGAGAAGLAVASRLEGTGLRVLLLESGGIHPSVPSQRLNQGETRGSFDLPLHSSRSRGLGGTANRWGGWCRPLDAVDLEERDWVQRSGWPIGYEDLAAWHGPAGEFLELPTDPFARHAAPSEPLTRAGFEPATFSFSPLAHTMRARADAMRRRWRDVTTLLDVTVVDMRTDSSRRRLSRLDVRRADGIAFTVGARVVVLATGAIEAARLLLATRRDRPAGLGNEHGLVGTSFMDHLHAQTGFVLTSDEHLRSPYFADFAKFAADQSSGALSASASAQRESRLLALGMTLTPAPHHFDPWPRGTIAPLDALHEAARSRADLAPAEGSSVPDVRARAVTLAAKVYLRSLRTTRTGVDAARFAPTRRRLRREAALRGDTTAVPLAMYVRSEQVPNHASKVVLSNERDGFGMPRAVLDWRLTEQDHASVDEWMARFTRAVEGAGIGHVLLDPRWRDRVHGGPHHLGTARMATDPRLGVVDADSRVHSVENLYVAGSAVFPTGGYANPTFELVALSLRLGEHLATTMAAGGHADPVTVAG